MKQVTLFYQQYCPFCVKAFYYIDELKKEHPELNDLTIETIDEIKEAALADQYDYYYVPTFYMDGKKVHEGAVTKPEVEKILLEAIK